MNNQARNVSKALKLAECERKQIPLRQEIGIYTTRMRRLVT